MRCDEGDTTREEGATRGLMKATQRMTDTLQGGTRQSPRVAKEREEKVHVRESESANEKEKGKETNQHAPHVERTKSVALPQAVARAMQQGRGVGGARRRMHARVREGDQSAKE